MIFSQSVFEDLLYSSILCVYWNVLFAYRNYDVVEYFAMAVIFLPRNPSLLLLSTVSCSKRGTGVHLWLALGHWAQ